MFSFNNNQQPSQSGFYMPGEHQPHQEIWMAWPTRPDNWRLGGKPAQTVFVEIATAISKKTQVVMIVPDEQFENARTQLPSQIKVVEMSYNDSWMRDIGATYLINNSGERCAVSWEFNAWGGLLDGLYFPWDKDNRVADKMAQLTEDTLYKPDFILEGGAIHSDGDGTVYATEECLLHPSRNPSLSKQDIEHKLKETLGAEKIIWLPKGLYNDETNGHIDNILHVVKPGTVMLTWCDDVDDPQYKISRQAYDVLNTEKDAKGRSIRVHKLPLPGPLYMTEDEASGIDHSMGMKREAGERLGASYANFLISNGQIIFPLLSKNTDDEAIETVKQAFPDYEVVTIDTREVVLGGGNIHCITQQVPVKKDISTQR